MREEGWAAAGYALALRSARFGLYRRTNVTVSGSSSGTSTGSR